MNAIFKQNYNLKLFLNGPFLLFWLKGKTRFFKIAYKKKFYNMNNSTPLLGKQPPVFIPSCVSDPR